MAYNDKAEVVDPSSFYPSPRTEGPRLSFDGSQISALTPDEMPAPFDGELDATGPSTGANESEGDPIFIGSIGAEENEDVELTDEEEEEIPPHVALPLPLEHIYVKDPRQPLLLSDFHVIKTLGELLGLLLSWAVFFFYIFCRDWDVRSRAPRVSSRRLTTSPARYCTTLCNEDTSQDRSCKVKAGQACECGKKHPCTYPTSIYRRPLRHIPRPPECIHATFLRPWWRTFFAPPTRWAVHSGCNTFLPWRYRSCPSIPPQL
jgi:hypothetical protein